MQSISEFMNDNIYVVFRVILIDEKSGLQLLRSINLSTIWFRNLTFVSFTFLLMRSIDLVGEPNWNRTLYHQYFHKGNSDRSTFWKHFDFLLNLLNFCKTIVFVISKETDISDNFGRNDDSSNIGYLDEDAEYFLHHRPEMYVLN